MADARSVLHDAGAVARIALVSALEAPGHAVTKALAAFGAMIADLTVFAVGANLLGLAIGAQVESALIVHMGNAEVAFAFFALDQDVVRVAFVAGGMVAFGPDAGRIAAFRGTG